MGRAVAKILCERGDSSIQLSHIFNRNVQRKKQDWIPREVVWTEDLESILNSDADIVIELIGGLTPAEQIVRRALESGKSVVTANKQLIARHAAPICCSWPQHGDVNWSSALRSPEGFQCCPRSAPDCAATVCTALPEFSMAPATTF